MQAKKMKYYNFQLTEEREQQIKNAQDRLHSKTKTKAIDAALTCLNNLWYNQEKLTGEQRNLLLGKYADQLTKTVVIIK